MTYIDFLNLLNAVLTIVATFTFLLLPYFVSLFTIKSISKKRGAYGSIGIKKSNLFYKIVFLAWFSLITYFVTDEVITDLNMKYITYTIAIITIILMFSNIISEIKAIRKG